jgi:hypothetical protein
MCDFKAEMTEKGAAAQALMEACPQWLVAIALIVLALLYFKRTRSPIGIPWLALCLWAAPVLAAKPAVTVWYRVMFWSGDCIGMPWLMMFPALFLSFVTAFVIAGGVAMAGIVPLVISATRKVVIDGRSDASSSRHSPR